MSKKNIVPVSGGVYKVVYRTPGSTSCFSCCEFIVATCRRHAVSILRSYCKDVDIIRVVLCGECILDRESSYCLPF